MRFDSKLLIHLMTGREFILAHGNVEFVDNAVGFKRKACQHRPMSSWTDERREDPKPCKKLTKANLRLSL